MKRNVLIIFLASPGDLSSERQIVRNAVERANKVLSRRIGWHIELLGWEDTLPGYSRPQELINKDVDSCNLFIGILWRRWGSESGEYSSGFEEEFVRARDRRRETREPELWLFLKSIDDETKRDPGEQLKRVLKFREEQIKNKELLFKEFDDANQWGQIIYDDLMSYVLDLSRQAPEEMHKEKAVSIDPSKKKSEKRTTDENKTTTPYPIELIKVFKKTNEKLSNNQDITLDIWEATRLYLQTTVWFSNTHNSEVFGNHEINLVYLKRKEWSLTGSEIWFLFRSFISDQYDNRPGWFWINHFSEKKVINLLIWLSIKDSNDSVREGAIKLICQAKISVKKEIISQWLGDDNNEIVLNAIKIINNARNIELLELLEPFIEHKDASIREEALNSKIVILYHIRPDESFKLLIDSGARLPEVINQTLNDMSLKVDKKILFDALKKAESHIRLFCSKYLRSAKLLTKEDCKFIFKDPDLLVRKEGLLGYIDLGHEVEMDFINKLFPEPKEQGKGLLRYALQPVRADEFWSMIFKKRKPTELLTELNFYQLKSIEAYRILLSQYFETIEHRVRRDLNDEFEGLRKESESMLRNKYGDVAESIYKGWDDDTITYVKSGFISAAIDGLAVHGKKSDLKYARKYICNTRHNVADEGAIQILKKYGNSSDVDILLKAASNAYGKTKIEALETAYKISSNKARFLNQLFEMEDEKTTSIAIKILSSNILPNKSEIAKSLLKSKNDDNRMKGLSIYLKNQTLKEIESFLSEYLAQETYYYNIISWVDKLLYSKGIFRKYYKNRISEVI